ncbi:MAG: hypothetical protein ACLFO1_05000 [Spirochaetaceae bacterium]
MGTRVLSRASALLVLAVAPLIVPVLIHAQTRTVAPAPRAPPEGRPELIAAVEQVNRTALLTLQLIGDYEVSLLTADTLVTDLVSAFSGRVIRFGSIDLRLEPQDVDISVALGGSDIIRNAAAVNLRIYLELRALRSAGHLFGHDFATAEEELLAATATPLGATDASRETQERLEGDLSFMRDLGDQRDRLADPRGRVRTRHRRERD